MQRSQKPELTDDQIMLLRTAGRSALVLWPFLLDPGKRFGASEIGKVLGIKRETAGNYLEALTPVFLKRESFHGGYYLNTASVEKLLNSNSTASLKDSTALIIINKSFNNKDNSYKDSSADNNNKVISSKTTAHKTDSADFDDNQLEVIDVLRKNKIGRTTAYEIARLEHADLPYVKSHIMLMNYEISLKDKQSKYSAGRLVQRIRGGEVADLMVVKICDACGGMGNSHNQVIAVSHEHGTASLKPCPYDREYSGHDRASKYFHDIYLNTKENEHLLEVHDV